MCLGNIRVKECGAINKTTKHKCQLNEGHEYYHEHVSYIRWK